MNGAQFLNITALLVFKYYFLIFLLASLAATETDSLAIFVVLFTSICASL